ncbi:MAG: tetratricopeptide repeat protein, partial [Lentisphaerae bacterium]
MTWIEMRNVVPTSRHIGKNPVWQCRRLGAFLVLALWMGIYPLLGVDRLQIEGFKVKAQSALAERRYTDAVRYFGEIFRQSTIAEEVFQAGLGWCEALYRDGKYDDAQAILALIPQRIKKLLAPRGGGGLKREQSLQLQYWRGLLLLEKGDVSGAEKAFHAVTKSVDADLAAKAYYQMGICRIRQHRYDEAEVLFRDIRTSNRVGSPLYVIGCLGTLKVLIERKRWNDFDRFYAQWRVHFQKEWYVQAKFLYLNRLLKAGLVRKAYEEYAETFLDIPQMQLPPAQRNHLYHEEFFQLLRTLGQQLVAGHEFKLARQFYVKLQPRLVYDSQQQAILLDMGIGAYRAAIYLKNHNQEAKAGFWYQLALDDFERFLKNYNKSPLLARVYYHMGMLYLTRRDEKHAVDAWSKAYGTVDAPAEDRYTAAVQLAQYYVSRNDAQKAVEWYMSAGGLNVSPALRARAWFQRGELLFKLGRYTEASKVFAQILQFYPEYPNKLDVYFNQGAAALRGGDYATAIHCFQNFITQAPENHPRRPEAIYRCALALSQAEHWDDAQNLFNKLIQHYPDSEFAPEAMIAAAMNARSAGFHRAALQFLTIVIERYRQTPFYYRALYERIFYLLNIRNDVKKALADFNLFFADKKKVYETYPHYS